VARAVPLVQVRVGSRRRPQRGEWGHPEKNRMIELKGRGWGLGWGLRPQIRMSYWRLRAAGPEGATRQKDHSGWLLGTF
jgi:hypothetical protein